MGSGMDMSPMDIGFFSGSGEAVVGANNTCSSLALNEYVPAVQQTTTVVTTGYFSGLTVTVLSAIDAAKMGVVNAYTATTTAVVTNANAAYTFAVENPVSVAVAAKVSELASFEGVLKIGVASVAAKRGVEWIQDSVESAKAIKNSYRTASKIETAKASVKVLGKAAVGAAVIAASVAVVVM